MRNRQRATVASWRIAALTGATLAALAGSAHAEVPLALTPAVASEAADFDVYLPPRNVAALERMVAEQSRLGSAQFHRWLTPGQFKARYAATPATVAAARQALARAGFTVAAEGPQSLHVVATARAVEAAFGVRLTHSRFVGGSEALVASRRLALPATLARLGAHVPQFSTVAPARAHSQVRPLNGNSALGDYYPADLRQAYDYPDVTRLDGHGVTVGILMAGDYSATDMTTFFNNDGLPVGLHPRITSIPIDGGTVFSVANSTETHLDIQQSAGMAPGVAVLLYNLPSLFDSELLSGLSAIVADDKADVVNMSYGSPEVSYLPVNNSGNDYTFYVGLEHWLYLQGNAEGITFVASSGDFGADPIATTCTPARVCKKGPTVTVEVPASDPNVTGVGGTNLVTTFAKGSKNSAYVRENANPDPIAGKNAGNWGAGGGISVLFGKPSYQALVPTPSKSLRTVPDLALHMGGCPSGAAKPCGADRSADVLQLNATKYSAIGTSASAPDIVGLLALKVSLTGARLGNENPDIYARAKAQIAAGTDATPFHHANIVGSNGVYAVKAPYDLVIGNGTVDARQFLGAMKLPASGIPGSASNP